MSLLRRISTLTGYFFIASVVAAYAAYAGLVFHFNDNEFFFTPAVPSASDKLPHMDVRIAPSTVQAVDRKLWPQEAREYHRIEGLSIDGKHYEASLKVRGWEKHHWQGDFNSRRRSWRVRLRGKERYRGMKTFNLRRFEFPTYLHGHLPYRLARELGLFAPHTDIAHVDWNGTYYGLMALWEQPGKSFGENHNRPPGLIFSNRFTQGVEDLWTHPRPRGREDAHWRTYPDMPPDERWDPLRRLLQTLHIEDDQEFLAALEDVLDLEAFIRIMAFWNLGGVYHQNAHNIRLYHNPDQDKLEWILWDIAGFHHTVRRFSYSAYMEERYPLDGCPNLLAYRLLRIPSIVEKKNQILWRWIREDISREKFKALIDEEARRIHDHVRAEPSRLYAYRYFLSAWEKFKRFVDTRYDLIENELDRLEVTAEIQAGTIDLVVDGQSGFRLLEIQVSDAGPDLSFFRDVNRNDILDDTDARLVGRNEGGMIRFPEGPLFLPARRDIPRIGPDPLLHEKSLEPAPATHRIFAVAGAADSATVPGAVLRLTGENSVTGRPVLIDL